MYKRMEFVRWTFDIVRKDGGFVSATVRKARDDEEFQDTFKTIAEVKELLSAGGILQRDIKVNSGLAIDY